MVLRCVRKVEAKGNYETAHRLHSRIGSIFRHAVDPSFLCAHQQTGLAERTGQKIILQS